MTHTADAEVYQVLVTLVRSLVDHPEEVEIACVPAEAGATFKISLAASDVGKVIGMSGRTARALRTILSANAARLRRNYSLDISAKAESSGGRPPAP